jgi:alpha-1,3-glucan synthase
VRNTSCVLPKLYLDDATLVDPGATNGCLESEFDAYGDMEAFGVHPDWQRQLSKFASVQDRLREWKPEVMAKLQVFSCLAITALDIDAIRVDKSTQVTVDALADWAASTRKCATNLGKKNFLITGEVTGGDDFGALYIGRGRTPTMRPDFSTASNLTGKESQYFLRDSGLNGLDSIAFHYSTYRSLTRYLGMDGNLQVAFDVDTNFVTSWKQMFVNDDFVNPNNNQVDPKHMFGTSNFDIFRWPSVENGTQKNVMASFISNLLMPGIPLLFYGEEQNFYVFDTGASNYLYGRQAMMGNTAWQRHGCYALGSDQYYNLNLRSSVIGCRDDWNSLDHFDPTSATRRIMARMLQLRAQYPVIQDGFGLDQYGNWTYYIQRPGSNGTATEMGLWSAARSAIDTQTLGNTTDHVWLLYTNENSTHTYNFNCATEPTHSPFQSGTTVQNLFAPYETYELKDSNTSFFNNGKPPMFGCAEQIQMEPFGFKALVPVADWVAPLPALTKFTPGHDARLTSNSSTLDISFEFNMPMDCDSVTSALSLNMSASGHGSTPSFSKSAVKCGAVTNPDPSPVAGGDTSQWSWAVTLQNVPDGILSLTLNNPKASGGTGAGTGSVDTLLVRKGAPGNVMVFPNSDYNNSAFAFSDGKYTFQHSAYGAELFRYSWNFGMNWTQWAAWEDTTTIDADIFTSSANWWEGDHIMVQCACAVLRLLIILLICPRQTGARLPLPSRTSCTPTGTTTCSAACRSSSPAARITSGASTRVSPRR